MFGKIASQVSVLEVLGGARGRRFGSAGHISGCGAGSCKNGIVPDTVRAFCPGIARRNRSLATDCARGPVYWYGYPGFGPRRWNGGFRPCWTRTPIGNAWNGGRASLVCMVCVTRCPALWGNPVSSYATAARRRATGPGARCPMLRSRHRFALLHRTLCLGLPSQAAFTHTSEYLKTFGGLHDCAVQDISMGSDVGNGAIVLDAFNRRRRLYPRAAADVYRRCVPATAGSDIPDVDRITACAMMRQQRSEL